MSDPAALEESASLASLAASDDGAVAAGSGRSSAPRVPTVCFVQDETAGRSSRASTPSGRGGGSLEEGPFNAANVTARVSRAGGENALRFRNRSSDARKVGNMVASLDDSGIGSPGCAHQLTATPHSDAADASSASSAKFDYARSSTLSARSVPSADHDGSIYSYGDQTPPALYAPKKRVRQLDRTPPRFYGVADEEKEGEAVVDELSELMAGLWSRLTGGDGGRAGRPRKARLFQSNTPTLTVLSPARLQAMLPALAVFVLAASSVFTVLTLRAAVDRSGVDMASLDYFSSNSIPNGKYASIEFGSRRRREALLREGKLHPEEVTEETGAKLGGKKAAIQFAHQMANNQEGEELVVRRVEETRPSVGADVGEAERGDRKELLDKISKFGQFDTIRAPPRPGNKEDIESKLQAMNEPSATESDEKWERTTPTTTEVKPVFVPGQATTTPQGTFVEDEPGGSSTREQTWVEEATTMAAQPGDAGAVDHRKTAAFAPASDEDDPFRFLPDH